MSRTLAAGLFYGLLIFGIGFILGTLRELVLAPLIGRDAVVVIETPVILLAAWFAAWWLIRRLGVPARAGARLAMGALAFAVLMAGEALVATLGFGRGLAAHLAAYATQRGVLELLPQIAFALLPLLHLFRQRSLT